MIRLQDIDTAVATIESLFIDQCAHGAQAIELSNLNAVACGQYLKYDTAKQRGLHGTAAALSVLARTTTDEGRRLSRGLLHYLDERDDIEHEVARLYGRNYTPNPNERLNVIKQSEVLYALSFVSGAIGPRDALVEKVARGLQGGGFQDKGWSYFLSDEQSPEILPTSYAIRALAVHGYPVDPQVSSLLHLLEQNSTSDTDIFVQSVGIFALTFALARKDQATADRLKYC